MGLSLLLIGFLILAIFFLDRSKPKFLPLNFVGGSFAAYERKHVTTGQVDGSSKTVIPLPEAVSLKSGEDVEAKD